MLEYPSVSKDIMDNQQETNMLINLILVGSSETIREKWILYKYIFYIMEYYIKSISVQTQ